MDEESPRKSLVKGERFVRHDDTSELPSPCPPHAGLRWNTSAKKEGIADFDLRGEKKEGGGKKRQDGGEFVFWK